MARPKIEDAVNVRSTSVNVRMNDQQYDRAYAAARRDDVSVPEVVRRAVDKVLAEPQRT